MQTVQRHHMDLMSVKRNSEGHVASIMMPRPSNFHAHLRSSALMRAVAHDTMCWVKHLLVMPNTGPIDTVGKLVRYYKTLTKLGDSLGVRPNLIMTIYLTDLLTPTMIEQLARLPFPTAVKYYPPHRGATTGSGHGIPLSKVNPDVFATMRDCNIRLLGHFESVYDKNDDLLPMEAREGYFMQHEFPWLRETYPDLRINIEHASTARAVERVKEDTSGKTTCGFTPHHLLFTIEELMERSWRNHGRCMPIPKSQGDVDACLAFATSGDSRAHLGDDTAPHFASAKGGMFEDAACGCWLPHSLALYALAFEKAGALDERFVRFACFNGPDAWGLPRPVNDMVMLTHDVKNDIPKPTHVVEENEVVIPLGWSTQADRLKIGLRLLQA